MNNLSRWMWAVLSLPVVAILASGCATARDSKYSKLAGSAAPRDGIEVFEVGDSTPLLEATVTATDGPIRIHVTGDTILFADEDDQGGYSQNFDVHVHPRTVPVSVDFGFDGELVEASAPEPMLASWFYYSGTAPVGRTRRVRAVGSGTTFIIDVQTNVDYVYMIADQDDYVDVYALLSSTPLVPCVRLFPGQFISVDDNGVCSSPENYLNYPVHADFVADAMAEASM